MQKRLIVERSSSGQRGPRGLCFLVLLVWYRKLILVLLVWCRKLNLVQISAPHPLAPCRHYHQSYTRRTRTTGRYRGIEGLWV
jgi:hypothetical protein